MELFEYKLIIYNIYLQFVEISFNNSFPFFNYI